MDEEEDYGGGAEQEEHCAAAHVDESAMSEAHRGFEDSRIEISVERTAWELRRKRVAQEEERSLQGSDSKQLWLSPIFQSPVGRGALRRVVDVAWPSCKWVTNLKRGPTTFRSRVVGKSIVVDLDGRVCRLITTRGRLKE